MNPISRLRQSLTRVSATRLLLASFALALLRVSPAFPQKHATGLIIEDDIASKIPKRATLRAKSYEEGVPKVCSLKKYAPSVKSQGGYGMCTAWSSTYAARTIVEAAANGWTDRAVIDREAFSPNFTYRLATDGDTECEKGAAVSRALKAMKDIGAVKMSDLRYTCLQSVPFGLLPSAAEHRIKEYFTTFERSDAPKDKVSRTKKAVSEGKAVVMVMLVYESVDDLRGNGVWDGSTSGRPPRGGAGGHAMCVVGYDDYKEGGAFEIMNSWGTGWGDKGFMWVKYDDYGKHAMYGNDIYVPPKQPPTYMAGSLQFKIFGGEEMKVALQNKGGLPVYKMTREGGHSSGTKFQIFLSNDNPAYVYAIGSDDNNGVEKIFPPDAKTSAALFDRKNDIALPDENGNSLYELDKTAGTTYALVLYSLTELPIDEIKEKIRAGRGDFTQKTKNAVGEDLVPIDEINLDRQNIKFSAKTRKPVVAIVVEIPHKRLD